MKLGRFGRRRSDVVQVDGDARPVAPRIDGDPDVRRAVFVLGARMLTYPDEQFVEQLPMMRQLAADLPASAARNFERFFAAIDGEKLLELQTKYVATFDLKRRCCLYLTYYLNGDTRKRGGALWRFQETYRIAGWRVDGGELPDFLPVLLEFAASGADEEAAALTLLDEHRQGLEVLKLALAKFQAPQEHALAAVLEVLPDMTPLQRTAAAMLVAEGPPTETVGLEPFTLTDISIGART